MRFHSDSTSTISTTLRAANASLRARFAARRERSVGRAAREVVEQLEQRRLLAVVAAGETAYYYNGTNAVKITVTGEGSISLVGFVRPRAGSTTGPTPGLSELPMTVFEADGDVREYKGGYFDAVGTSGNTAQPPIYELYSIYSGDSTSKTSVAISTVTPRTGQGPTLPRLPSGAPNAFGGTAGSLFTTMTDPGDDNPLALTLTNGGVFLGGRTGPTENEQSAVYSQTKNVSIATGPGVSLKKNATLKPGIYVNGSFDNFFFGGTITGAVSITGSVDTFYAGNILTGDVEVGAFTNVIGTDNFFVGGDLRNLITAGGIGTLTSAPQAFIPNTDIQVGGRVQQIKAGTAFRAGVDVVGGYNAAISDGSQLTELETRRATNTNAAGIGNAFHAFQIVNQGFANNDTFNSPQILGSYYSPDRKRSGQAQIAGSLSNTPNTVDNADYYGLPLLAGQSAVVQVATNLSLSAAPVALQVYDPDGNIVFSDYSNQNAASFLNKAFTVKADQPGLWRLAVVPLRTNVLADRSYTLTVDKAGEMAIGGVQSGGTMYLANTQVGIRGREADIGSILAGGDLYSEFSFSTTSGNQPDILNSIISNKGNVRSVEADNFGYLSGATLFTDTFPTIRAKKTVGLVRTSVNRLYFNQYSRAGTDRPSENIRIGGDYQVIETPGDFSAVLSAGGGIGVIRVGSVSNDVRISEPGYFEINNDASGNDGVIGLIDVTGNLGTFTKGGPAIGTVESGNGNVRYIHVGGNAYRDARFGAGNTLVQSTTNAAFGRPFQDESGALITITPIASETYTAPADVPSIDPTQPGGIFGGATPTPFPGGSVIPNPFGGGTIVIPTTDTNGDGVVDENDVPTDDPTDPGDLTTAGTVTVETYPTRLGGAVILKVTATQGVQISSTGSGSQAAAEIGQILTGSGTVTINSNSDGTLLPSQETAAELNTGTTLEVILTGSVRTSAFYIGGTSAGANYSRIVNSTDGEILNLDAGDVGYLEAQYLGIARTAANVAIEGRTTFGTTANSPPSGLFGTTRNAIRVSDAIEIRSRGVIGSITAGGVIQNVIANSDNINTKGLLEGIVGVVYAGSELRNVEIGEGLATSGTGDQVLAGLFSNDTIGTITNVFGAGDLRGDVIARQNVEAINITGGGSIIDSDILQVGTIATDALLAGNEQFATLIELVGGISTDSGIGKITVEGNGGGIMNAQVVGLNIGLTTVGSGGFGVVNSTFFSSGGGRMDGIQAAGLGIRGVEYIGGGTMGDIVATGGGRLADLNDYTQSVRGSNSNYFDAVTGIAPNASNDLYLYFQTSASDSAIIGVTNEGIISDSNIAASQSIGNIRAFDFRTFNNPLGYRARDQSYPNQINFGQSIGSITAKRDIDGLRVIGASLGSLVARDIKNFQLQATGAVGTINAKRNVAGTVNFNLVNDGALNKLAVGGNFNGTLFAARGINTIIVDGSVASQAISGGIYSGLNIRTIRIGGDVREGSYIRARKRINGITINGDLEANATIRANPFGKISIKGATNGKIQRN